ncbi:unnamed protein product [Peronospora effusa]|nr:unnamed protein product [Peronospora effusa]
MAKYDENRVDYLAQAEELAHFAQSVELDTRNAASFGKDVVTHVAEGKARVDTRTCYGCGKVGHIQFACPDDRKKSKKNKGAKGTWRGNGRLKEVFNYTLSVQDDKAKGKWWILDSGSIRHLVNDMALLEDARKCNDQCLVADGKTLRLTMVGSVVLHVMAYGRSSVIWLTDVYYSPLITRNIVSYGKPELKEYGIKYKDNRRALISLTTGNCVFDVAMCNNVLVLETQNTKVNDEMIGTVMAAIDKAIEKKYEEDVMMARDPNSGIRLTDNQRVTCVTCAQAKQTKNAQSKKYTGVHSPIDRIGGVICSDLKGPITPKDRMGNRPTSSNTNRASPIEVLTKQAPDLRDIGVFGSTCTVYRDPKKNSLAHRAQVEAIMGRSDEKKGYRVFIRKDNIVMVTQHVNNIQRFPDTQNAQLEYHDDISRGDARISHGNICDNDKKKKGKGRGKRWTRAPYGTRGATKRSMAETMPATNYVATALQVHEPDPKTHAEEMSSSKAEGWIKAMLEEIQALEYNDVWNVIKRPADANLLHSKWVYKTKTDANGAV